MRKQLFLSLMLTVLVLGGFSLTACNTVEGAGQDIENTGEYIEGTARDASN